MHHYAGMKEQINRRLQFIQLFWASKICVAYHKRWRLEETNLGNMESISSVYRAQKTHNNVCPESIAIYFFHNILEHV